MNTTWHGRRAVVFGGCGFLGSTICLALEHAGADVVAVDAFVPQMGANAANLAASNGRVQLVRTSMQDADTIRRLFTIKTDAVFLAAGQTGHAASMRAPLVDLEHNAAGRLQVLELARELAPRAPLVLLGTRQVYGRPIRLPVDENHQLRPADINAVHNLTCENYLSLYHRVYGQPTVSLRLSNCYGPRQQLRGDTQSATGIMMRLALGGQTVKLFDGGIQRRDFVYADDAAAAAIIAAETPMLYGGAWNVGGFSHPIRAYAEAVAKHIDFPMVDSPRPTEQAAIDVGDFVIDDTAFRTATGWAPTVDLELGVSKSVSFFQAHREEYLA